MSLIHKKFSRGMLLTHIKTGKLYVVVETPSYRLTLESTNEPAYIYEPYYDHGEDRPNDFKRWIRSQKEMEDGRFVPTNVFTKELCYDSEDPGV